MTRNNMIRLLDNVKRQMKVGDAEKVKKLSDKYLLKQKALARTADAEFYRRLFNYCQHFGIVSHRPATIDSVVKWLSEIRGT